MNKPLSGSGPRITVSQMSGIFLVRWGLAEPSWVDKAAIYVLLLAIVAVIVMFITWRLHRKDVGKLNRELEEARSLAL